MEHPPLDSSQPAERAHPLWVRGTLLALIWTLVLQPAVSSAQLSQIPMFTVTSAPPNVMLMFDDSASMNRLDLNPPPQFANPTSSFLAGSGNPQLKLNTVGYFGISGSRWYYGGNTAYDNGWEFLRAEVLLRSATFNPLHYNPAIRYRPWNNNGALLGFGDAAYGGSTNVPLGALTQWDPRSLPGGGGPVSARLGPLDQGVIHTSGVVRSWVGPTGSVSYAGLFDGTAAPSGADLFTSTIAWQDPNCTTAPVADTYGWYCPSGSPWVGIPAADTCGGTIPVGGNSTSGTCCTLRVDSSSTADTPDNLYAWYYDPPYGPSPPPMVPPGDALSPTCTYIVPTASTAVDYGAPCVPGGPTVDDPPYEVPCPPGGGEVCFYDPPPVTPPPVCTPYPRTLWACGYVHPVTTITPGCPAANQIPQVCYSSPNPNVCVGNPPPTPTSDAQYVAGYWTPARYVIYDGPQPGTLAEHNDLKHYRMIMIDRKFGWNNITNTRDLIDNVSKWKVRDGVTGADAPAGSRPDCTSPNPEYPTGQDGTWCTFDQEAQNYANWYTYYRSRLFAAVGVMSEVASGLTGPEQFMRMGYGRINYFPQARNPWNVQNVGDRLPASLPNIDGAASVGGVERGVRPFTVNDPPLSAIPNAARQNVFDWLFSINGQGPTPNREAMHAAGLYFTRQDSPGPWGATPGSGTEAATSHLWCRRNFSLLATDGEWTKLPTQEPRLESMSFPNPMGGPGSVLRSLNIDGPAIMGTNRDTGVAIGPGGYVVATDTNISGGFGSTDDKTLTDVLLYYQSRDIRPDLRNSMVTNVRDDAFWQHMTSYVVGYGVNASMDVPGASPSLRAQFDTPQSIAWPEVGPEACRQLDDNARDLALNPSCTHTVAPSGNRINDSLRGALASGGEFFSASTPTALKASLEAVFAAIGSENAAGTSPGLSSSTVGAGNLIIQSGFFTNTWHGYVHAYDQVAELRFLRGLDPQPPTVWTINFATPALRPIYSTTAITTAIPFTWAGLAPTPVYQTALDAPNTGLPSSPVLDYLRGEQSKELRIPGGTYRNRTNTILGDIVHSTPLYSKGADHGYLRRPAAAKVLPAAATQGADIYDDYVVYKRSATRHALALFGANDGMLHVLDARVGQATSGKEVFAFVPRSQFFTLRDLSSPAYVHQFYVDGPIIESDVFTPPTHATPNAWKTVAIGTTGAGPAGMFAIDITSPQSGFGAGNVMWDIVPSEHPGSASQPTVVQTDLGNVLQPGIVGSVKLLGAANGAGQWVYMVGNGYESASHKATLFVFDVFTGALIKAIETGVGSVANRNGLGGITPVFDGNRNIVAVYGGDKQGNMWKFDFSSGYIDDPDGALPLKGWEIYNRVGAPPGTPAPLFVATDGAGVKQPITVAPRITPHGISGLHVGFGTGKLFEVNDRSDLQVQAVYVLWDKGQLPTIAKTDLQPIALEDAPWDHDANIATLPIADGTFRQLKQADLNLYDWTKEGFYIPLIQGTADGERILSPGIFDGGVLTFTSFAQQAAGGDLCTPGGSSHVYRFNLIGGLAEAGFLGLGVTAPVVGKRVQPGLVSAAPPIYDPYTPAGGMVDSLSIADAKTLMQQSKYKQSGGVAKLRDPNAVGTCAHVGLKIDGTVARIETACAGLLPLRAWGSGVR